VQRDQMLEALRAETERVAGVMAGVSEDDFDRTTRCRPWSVRDLLAHLLVASNRLPAMLAEPQPPEADVSAAGYYRSDRRFGGDATRTRIASASDVASSFASGHVLVRELTGACREMLALAGNEPPERLVRTRWGDAMSLVDFVVTRVAELGIHGLDLADGLGRSPWLTTSAADIIEELLLGEARVDSVPGLEWDQLTLIYAATGRRPVSDTEKALLTGHGVHLLTFG